MKPSRNHLRSVVRALRFSNVGAVYVLAAIVVVFSIWAPETFPTSQTATTILNQNAITALAALSLLIPLSARVFDLSIGYVMGFCAVLVAYLLVDRHMGVAPAVAITLAAAVLLGAANATVVVVVGIDSFIATLATGALVSAGVIGITGQQPIVGAALGGPFGDIAQTSVGGVAVPAFVALGLGVGLWWLLDHTATGRRLYATGFNDRAARLAGVRTARLRFVALVASATIVGVAGVLVASEVSAGSPDIGPSYLLDAYAAAFLGATQFRGGRFNPAGTILAVLMLGTGKTGLTMVGAPLWASSMFSGVVLLAALALTKVERAHAARAWVARRRAGRSDRRFGVARETSARSEA